MWSFHKWDSIMHASVLNCWFVICDLIISELYTNAFRYRLTLVKCNGKERGLLCTHMMIGEQYSDVIMSAMTSQITFASIVCSTVSSGAYQRKHQSSASLAFAWVIHRWPVNSPHKGPVPRKMFLYNSKREDAKFFCSKLDKKSYFFCQ